MSDTEISWDTYLTLIAEYAPPQFKPHLDHWLAPEQMANVPNLSAIDKVFRSVLYDLDTGSEELQEKLATILDEDMSPMIEKWLGAVYAPYSLFPSSVESTTDIDLTKLNAIIYLLNAKEKTRRKSMKPLTLGLLRKTRRNKQNGILQLYIRAETSDGANKQNTYSEGSQREGGEDHSAEGEGHTEDQHETSQ